MIVTYEMDRMGCLTLRPVSQRWQRRITRHLQGFGAVPTPAPEGDSAWAESCRDGSVFLQTDYDVEAELESLRPSQARDVREGWPVRVRMDVRDYLGRVGYDATVLA
jgi:hypothetical protein